MTADRERAEALRRCGWGYKRIAHELGLTRDVVREWLRPRPPCPDCGGAKSRNAQRCQSCSVAARRKP